MVNLPRRANHQESPRDFPRGPLVKTSPSNVGDVGSILGRGAKTLYALGPKCQNMKPKHFCNKFNIDFFFLIVHLKKKESHRILTF